MRGSPRPACHTHSSYRALAWSSGTIMAHVKINRGRGASALWDYIAKQTCPIRCTTRLSTSRLTHCTQPGPLVEPSERRGRAAQAECGMHAPAHQPRSFAERTLLLAEGCRLILWGRPSTAGTYLESERRARTGNEKRIISRTQLTEVCHMAHGRSVGQDYSFTTLSGSPRLWGCP